jgi:hypothetical protein
LCMSDDHPTQTALLIARTLADCVVEQMVRRGWRRAQMLPVNGTLADVLLAPSLHLADELQCASIENYNTSMPLSVLLGDDSEALSALVCNFTEQYIIASGDAPIISVPQVKLNGKRIEISFFYGSAPEK